MDHVPVPYGLGGEVAPREAYYYPDYAGHPAEGTDWERIGRLLWQRKWWIIATVLLGTAAGWVAASFVEPEYQTFTRVWVEDQGNQQQRGGAVRQGDLLEGEGWADVFSSRAVIVPVVRDLGLQIRVLAPEGVDRATAFEEFDVTTEILPGTYTYAAHENGRWTLDRDGDGRLESGAAGEPAGESSGFRWIPPSEVLARSGTIRFSVGTLQEATLRVATGLDVMFNPNSSLIRAQLTWSDRGEAAPILNALAEQFIQVANDLKAQKIREEVEMLEEQTQYTQQQLESAEFALQNYKVETITLPSEPMVAPLPGGGMGAQGETDPMFGAFANNRLQVDQLQYDLQQIRQVQASLSRGSEPNLLTLQMIPSVGKSTELQAAIQDLQTKRNQKRTFLYQYTEEWPAVRQLTQEIRDIQGRIIPAALGRLGNELQSQIALLGQQIESQSEQLREIPERTITNARLQREMDHAATLHNSLLLRKKQAELAEATSGPGIEILDAAWPPTSPLGEKAGRLIALFAMAS
ncbi:MAG: GumC family protein, partial [Gemmatimonadota bacterium]